MPRSPSFFRNVGSRNRINRYSTSLASFKAAMAMLPVGRTQVSMLNYPNDADGEALQRVAEDGNDMSRPMAINFHIAAPDETAAIQIAKDARLLGYLTEIVFDDEELDLDDDPIPPWTCECTKTMVPNYDDLIAAQSELHIIARRVGGYADGWGTFGNAAGSS